MSSLESLVNPQPFRPKRALVLSGGGARGAYEIGVLKALQEKRITFDVVFGTSVGGINAAFFAQGRFNRLEELWRDLKATDIFRFPTFNQIHNMLNGTRRGLLDTSPMETLLYREMNLDALRNSNLKVGFLTTDLCTLETRLITTDDIHTLGQLVDTIMASSALPILFPARNLNGEGFWIDGGMVRNTPIQTAINMGAKEIYIVLVQAETDGACPTNVMQVLSRCADILLYASARDGIRMVDHYNKVVETNKDKGLEKEPIILKVFQPHDRLNYTVLDIVPSQSRLLIEQGYHEAMNIL